MKNYFFILMFLPLMAMTSMDDGISEISTAISTGDAESLSKHFDEEIELTVLEKVEVYNKQEAKKAIGAFFASNKPKSFNSVHKGTSKGKESQYMIGNLVTGASTYRVYIYMKIDNGNHVIQELRFDEE